MFIDPHRIQKLFLEAVAVPTPAGRSALLDRACADDLSLRERVVALLRAHELPDNALDTPALDALSLTPCDEQVVGGPRYFDHGDELATGTVIASRYRLIDRLGEGGMGTVYRAEQFAPIRRTIAIKLIRSGLDTKATLARFASERQALALMDHPNIAKVLDAGTVECSPGALSEQSSRPYFVMELVDGTPLSKYCAEKQLTLRERLQLFVPVCEAIQHAHQKGVIHRDLKPGNVLVATRNGRPVPMVIDFGIAKSMGDQLGDIALETGPGLLMGSLDYMAPEQAAHESQQIDTRTDVYALGAMLYELVCGSVPFDRQRMRQASVFGVASMICEEVPPAPSQRAAKEPAGVRAGGLPHDHLATSLRGDVDWIVMKCLEKDRDRRYPTAIALADDINRFLSQLPVLAGAPTVSYRVRKFVQRHLAVVGAAVIVLLSLVGGIAGTTWGLVQAKRSHAIALAERDEKEQARADEEQHRIVAEKERARADTEAEVAKSVVNFVQNDLLRQADSQNQSGAKIDPDPNLTVRAALDRAAATVDRRFRDQPAVEAAIRRTIGRAYDGLGEFAKAIKHLTRSVALYETLESDSESADVARQDLGVALRHAGRFEEAIPLLVRAYAGYQDRLGPSHRQTLAAATNLGIAYEKAGKPDDSHRLFNEVYNRLRETDASPMAIMAALNNLACLDANRGRLNDAILHMEELQSTWESKFGPGSQRLELQLNLGQMYLRANRWDDAIESLDAARATAQKRLSPEHPSLLTACFLLAEAHSRSGNTEEAGRVLEDARNSVRERVGPTHVRYHVATIELASLAAESGQLDRAKKLIDDALTAIAPSGNSASYTRASAQVVLARFHHLMGRAKEAEPLVREALPVLESRRPDDWPPADARVLLGLVLVAQERLAEAEPMLTVGVAGYKRLETQLPHAARRKYPDAVAALARCAEARNAADEAASWRAEHQRLTGPNQ